MYLEAPHGSILGSPAEEAPGYGMCLLYIHPNPIAGLLAGPASSSNRVRSTTPQLHSPLWGDSKGAEKGLASFPIPLYLLIRFPHCNNRASLLWRKSGMVLLNKKFPQEGPYSKILALPICVCSDNRSEGIAQHPYPCPSHSATGKAHLSLPDHDLKLLLCWQRIPHGGSLVGGDF